MIESVIFVPSNTNYLEITFDITATVNLPKNEDPQYSHLYRDVLKEFNTIVNQQPYAEIDIPPGYNYYREDMNLLKPKIDWRGDGPGYTEMEFPIYPWLIAGFYKIFG